MKSINSSWSSIPGMFAFIPYFAVTSYSSLINESYSFVLISMHTEDSMMLLSLIYSWFFKKKEADNLDCFISVAYLKNKLRYLNLIIGWVISFFVKNIISIAICELGSFSIALGCIIIISSLLCIIRLSSFRQTYIFDLSIFNLIINNQFL